MALNKRRVDVVALVFLVMSGCKSRSSEQPMARLPSDGSGQLTVKALPDDAAGIFEKMRAAACAGDVETFFSYVAEPTVLDNLAKRSDAGAGTKATINLDGWRKDIKDRGKNGVICAWSFNREKWARGDDLLQLDVGSRSGRKRLVFGNAGEQLKLFDYESVSEPRVDASVDAQQLLKDYKDNELRGDAQYKGKRILLVGKAGEVKRDVTGAIYLTVNSGADSEGPEAQCFFDEEDSIGLAAISHGQLVAVSGVVVGLMGNVLVKTCSLSSTTALDACHKLRDAGVVAQCVVKWMTVDSVVPFLLSNPPPGLSPAKMSDFLARTTGFVTYARVYEEDDGGYARTLALGGGQDAGLRFVNIGSPSARIVFALPSGAAEDLRGRAKTVVDHLPPASQ